jgi:hypothetical protein
LVRILVDIFHIMQRFYFRIHHCRDCCQNVDPGYITILPTAHYRQASLEGNCTRRINNLRRTLETGRQHIRFLRTIGLNPEAEIGYRYDKKERRAATRSFVTGYTRRPMSAGLATHEAAYWARAAPARRGRFPLR